MAVTAKFYVSKATQHADQPHPEIEQEPQVAVTLEAVYGTRDHPNAEWSKFTPSGHIEMLITNPDAMGYFEPGKEYTVTFTKAQPQKARPKAS